MLTFEFKSFTSNCIWFDFLSFVTSRISRNNVEFISIKIFNSYVIVRKGRDSFLEFYLKWGMFYPSPTPQNIQTYDEC